jgi:hypothetical protein
MGCDHYLMLMRKPTDKEIAHASKRLPHQTPLMVIAKDESGWNTLKDIGVKAPGFSEQYDYDLIKQDNGVPEEAEIHGFSCNANGVKILWMIPNGDKTAIWQVNIPDQQMDQEYTTYEYGERLYVHSETIRQWRNNDIIRDLVRRTIPVENCEYHVLDEQTIQAICAIDQEASEAMKAKKDGDIVVYHEWY